MPQFTRRDLLIGSLGAGLLPATFANGATMPKGPLLGACLGNSGIAGIVEYEAWLGRRLDFVQVFTGRRNWSDYIDSIHFGGKLFRNTRPIHWSVPLFEQNGSLEQAAAGNYDKYWRKAIKIVRSYSPGEDVIFLRSGWEFNYKGQEWFSGGKEALFVEAIRRFVSIMRSVSDRFRFVWCPNVNVRGQNTELSYPGDDFVDVIGMDFYVWRGVTSTPAETWAFYRDAEGNYGLNWLVRFGKLHNKPIAIDEWGIMFDGYEDYVAAAAAFFRENDFLYTAYWEQTSAYQAKLSDNRLPSTAARFLKEFGAGAPAK